MFPHLKSAPRTPAWAQARRWARTLCSCRRSACRRKADARCWVLRCECSPGRGRLGCPRSSGRERGIVPKAFQDSEKLPLSYGVDSGIASPHSTRRGNRDASKLSPSLRMTVARGTMSDSHIYLFLFLENEFPLFAL